MNTYFSPGDDEKRVQEVLTRYDTQAVDEAIAEAEVALQEKDMGKVIERVKFTNFVDSTRSVEVDVLIDTGATTVALPEDIVARLGLKKGREAKVRYANNTIDHKSIFGVAVIEIQGRSANFDVIAEVPGSQPLIGQVVLELLDFVVDPKNRRLMPNPLSPDMPMLDLL